MSTTCFTPRERETTMAHNITNLDNVALNTKPAWHGLGVMIENGLSAVDAGERIGMFWPVEQFELEAIAPDGTRIPIRSHVANVRTKDNKWNDILELLGVVGRGYEVCQNRQLAEFTDALAQTGKVTIESCGTLKGGKKLWFLARGEGFDIGSKDRVFPYVMVSNSHDGSSAIYVTPTTVRVVCDNTFSMVVGRDGSCESAAFRMQHSGKLEGKLEAAKFALKQYDAVLARNRELMEATREKKVNDPLAFFAREYSRAFEVPTNEELSSKDEKVRRLAQRRRDRMDEAARDFMARHRKEAEVSGGDNAWAAFNAWTGYVQHDRKGKGKDDNARAENRLESNLFGTNEQRTREAFAAALAL